MLVVIIPRLKAGLKLQEESEKREVEQGIHLLQDPQGACLVYHACFVTFVFIRTVPPFPLSSLPLAITQKAREAQLQRQKDKDKIPVVEMETNG